MKHSIKHTAIYTCQSAAIAVMIVTGAQEKMAEHGYLGQFVFWGVIVGLAVIGYEAVKSAFRGAE